MLQHKQTRDSVYWKVGRLPWSSNSLTINSKAIQQTRSRSTKSPEYQHSNSKPSKPSNKSICNIWERRLKSKSKWEDLLRGLSSQEESWLIFVRIWRIIIEHWLHKNHWKVESRSRLVFQSIIVPLIIHQIQEMKLFWNMTMCARLISAHTSRAGSSIPHSQSPSTLSTTTFSRQSKTLLTLVFVKRASMLDYPKLVRKSNKLCSLMKWRSMEKFTRWKLWRISTDIRLILTRFMVVRLCLVLRLIQM